MPKCPPDQILLSPDPTTFPPFTFFYLLGTPKKLSLFQVCSWVVTCCRLSLIRPSVAVLCWPCFCVAYFLLCPRSLSLKDRRSCQSPLLSPRLLLLQQHLPPSPAVAVCRVYSAPADAVFRVYAAVASWSLSRPRSWKHLFRPFRRYLLRLPTLLLVVTACFPPTHCGSNPRIPRRASLLVQARHDQI